MRMRWCLGVLLMLVVALASPAQDDEATTDVERKTFTFGQAWAANDLKTLDRLVAPEYIHTTPAGLLLHRQEFFKMIQERKEAARANTMRYLGLSTRIFGNAAVITAEAYIGDIKRGAAVTSLRNRVTQVWVRRNSDWQIVAYHSTRIEADRSAH